MRKVYAIRAVGTDKWAVSFRQDRANLGLFENARFYNKIGPARGLATKSTKSNGIALEVVEFSLEEVKPAKAPNWDEFKKYVDEEIQKVKPLFPNYPPYIPTSPCDGDKPSPWERRRKPDIWCGRKPQNEPIMMNTPENPSLMVACST